MDSKAAHRLAEQGPWLELLLSHLAGRWVRSHFALEDLVQEVFLRALSPRASLPLDADGEPALRRYLASVARSVTFDALRALRTTRRRGSVQRIHRDDFSRSGVKESHLADPRTGPLTAVGRAEESALRLQAFAALAPDHRRVLGLRQFEGLSAAEAGLRMGRSETAIHSLYRRALQEWSRRSEA